VLSSVLRYKFAESRGAGGKLVGAIIPIQAQFLRIFTQVGGSVPGFTWPVLSALLVSGAALYGIDQNVLGMFHDDGIYAALGATEHRPD
jgi:hypothetical protein